jgi:hypothetical protein
MAHAAARQAGAERRKVTHAVSSAANGARLLAALNGLLRHSAGPLAESCLRILEKYGGAKFAAKPSLGGAPERYSL